MKIYEIGTGYTPIPAEMGAATEIVVEELTKAFLKQGQAVEIIDIAAANRRPHQLPIREVKVPGCFASTDVKLGIMHKLKRVVYSVALAGALKKILRETEEKVVLHFHNQYNLFFFLKLTSEKLRSKCCIAYTNHSGIWRLDWGDIASTIKTRYFQEALCMQQADAVFVLNEETKQNVVRHLSVPEDRIIPIGNGVNTRMYYPLPEEQKAAAQEKWGVSDRKVILQVGSVYENKGQLRSIQQLEPFMKEDPKLLYLYAGGVVDEGYHQQVTDYVRKHGLQEQVRYAGVVSPGAELNELYNTALATILSSRYEAFSLVVAESLAAGVPVLINHSCPMDLGEGCVRFDAEGGAEAVKMALRENARLSAAARENAVNHYSWEKIARDYSVGWKD